VRANIQISKNGELYPYSFIYKGIKTILIWQSNDNDSFILDSNKRLIKAISKKEMRKVLGKLAVHVKWKDAVEMNFDSFIVALRCLRENRASSPKTCSLLIDGWNFIEDMLATFSLKQDMKRLKTRMLNKAYKKLFHGINLPAVTPKGKCYSPLWEHEEIITLRRELIAAWNNLHKAQMQ
jgi:hypothetical protein